MKEREKERKESEAAINYLLSNPPVAAHPIAADLFESLWRACVEGEVGRARQILLSGVERRCQLSKSWFYPTMAIACQKGHTECLSLLINHGAQLDKANNEGATPAHIACENGYTDCLSLLVNQGVDCSDRLGPIRGACQSGHFECAKALLDRGKVDVNCTTTINRQTPAFFCCVYGHVKILHLLIQHGADLSLADASGSSPAHMASAIGNVKMLALIKKVNADLINQRDNQGRTPLLYARESSQNGAAEWLIEHGAEEAGEPSEDMKLEASKVQLIQMQSITLTRPFISHKSSSLYSAGYNRGDQGNGSIDAIGV
jgi:ankyrin repeat protein